MLKSFKSYIYTLLRQSEVLFKTDMVYATQNTFWVNANTIILTIGSLFLSILFAHFVSKDTYGTYQFILSIGLLLGAFSLTGMNTSVTQAVARGFDGILKSSVQTQLKFSIIPFIIGTVISLYYFSQNNIIISIGVLLTAAFLPLTNSLNTWSAYLAGKKQFKLSFFYNQIINTIYYVGTALSIIFFPKALALITITLLANFIANLIAYSHISKKYLNNNPSESEALNYGKKLSLSSILPMIALHSDNLLVFHLLGAQNLAIYAFASNIPDRFMSFLRPLSTIAFPKMSEKSHGAIINSVLDKIGKLFFISLIWGIIYIIIAPIIYASFFPQYISSLKYSILYIVYGIISTASTLTITALFAKRSSKIFQFNIINPIINISCIVIGGYSLGIWGIIIGRITGSIFSLLLSLQFIQKQDETIV